MYDGSTDHESFGGQQLARSRSIEISSKNQRIRRKVLGTVLESSEIDRIQVSHTNSKDVEITFRARVAMDRLQQSIHSGIESEQLGGRPSQLKQITYEEPFERAEKLSMGSGHESEEETRAKRKIHLNIEHTASERSRSVQSRQSRASRKSKSYLALPAEKDRKANARAQINRASQSDDEELPSSSVRELFPTAGADDPGLGPEVAKASTPKHRLDHADILENHEETARLQKADVKQAHQYDRTSEISEESPL